MSITKTRRNPAKKTIVAERNPNAFTKNPAIVGPRKFPKYNEVDHIPERNCHHL